MDIYGTIVIYGTINSILINEEFKNIILVYIKMYKYCEKIISQDSKDNSDYYFIFESVNDFWKNDYLNYNIELENNFYSEKKTNNDEKYLKTVDNLSNTLKFFNNCIWGDNRWVAYIYTGNDLNNMNPIDIDMVVYVYFNPNMTSTVDDKTYYIQQNLGIHRNLKHFSNLLKESKKEKIKKYGKSMELHEFSFRAISDMNRGMYKNRFFVFSPLENMEKIFRKAMSSNNVKIYDIIENYSKQLEITIQIPDYNKDISFKLFSVKSNENLIQICERKDICLNCFMTRIGIYIPDLLKQ